MIVIKKSGAYLIRKGEELDHVEFEEGEETLKRIIAGDYSEIQEFLNKYPGEELVLDENEDVRTLTLEAMRDKMAEALDADYTLIQILSAYDDVTAMLNLMSERLAEFENVEEIKREKIEECEKLREEMDNLKELRDYLGERIEQMSEKLAENLVYLLGPTVAARLIRSAGGLKRLAMLPASTIQVLGAEDAFFQHLKKGTPCPKHGIIFQVPEIRNSPKRLRGRIARALAGKIAIAARVDYYGGEFVADKLKDEFLARVEEIKNDTHRKGR